MTTDTQPSGPIDGGQSEGAVPGDPIVTSDSGGSTCEFCGLWIPPDRNYCMHGIDWYDL